MKEPGRPFRRGLPALPPFLAFLRSSLLRSRQICHDQGTFEGLPDPILAWDVMRVDDEAENQVHAIWERALVETLKVAESCDERLAKAPEAHTRLLGYLMSTFEAPERPEGSSA